MGSTHRFLAVGNDLQQVYDWLAALPEHPVIIPATGCQYVHFATLGGLIPPKGPVDVKKSPVASLFPPELIRAVVWTAGELHFLPTPLRALFPKLDNISRKFSKWLGRFDCVYEGPGKAGDWDYFLEGCLRNHGSPIVALPQAMSALRAGQYFISHGFGGDALDRLCRSLELRGVNGAVGI
jgi:hypothetical protein